MSTRRNVLVALVCAGLPAKLLAQDKGRTGGIIGAHDDPGKGAVLSSKKTGTAHEVIYQIGRPGVAPYAKVQLVVEPDLLVDSGVLKVEYRAKISRLEAKIPGGLGAFWEIDLQNQEGSLMQGADLEFKGARIAPARPGSGGGEFKVDPSARPPFTLIFKTSFFGTQFEFKYESDKVRYPVKRRRISWKASRKETA